MMPPPPGPRRGKNSSSEMSFSGTNPMRHKTSASVPNVPSTVNATRAAPPPPGKKVTKQRRMSSREFMQQAATANSDSSSAGRNAGGKTTAAFPAVTKSKSPPPSPSSSGHHVRAATTGGINKGQISLPQHPDIKLHVTKEDRTKNYRRGSITERYRRASVFNEIIKEQQKKSEEMSNVENGTASKGRGHHHSVSRVDVVQQTSGVLSVDHRSRIMAYEHMSHSSHSDGFIINPYCVASMPEPIRKAFVIKVCGIVLTQMLLMLGVVCIIKYSGLGHEIIKGYTMWSLLTTFIPLIFLAVLMGVRKMHPWNLVAFSCFTLSWAYSLGIACVWLESRLFVSVTGLTVMNTLGTMGFARFVSYDKFNFCNCSMLVCFLSTITIFISYGIYPAEPWGNHIWPAFISLIFGSWICWDLKALQIDLTADEYIIGAVDLYLDILNMFLWALICCLHCFETILKG